MIDFNSLKEKMSEDEIKKLDLGLSRLRVLTPDAREQILNAMEAMINCENLKSKESDSVNKSSLESNLCTKKLLNLLNSKYDELKMIAKCTDDHKFHEMNAVARVLKLGTYDEGARAIDVLIKINLIKYLMNPDYLFETEMED
jgi:hypothetical protein